MKKKVKRLIISIPGIGPIEVGPDSVSSKKATKSTAQLLKDLSKLQKENIFPPLDHGYPS